MEVFASAAVMGLVAGAVIGQATGRVVERTLDMAMAGAGRAYENLAAKDPSDPETRRVFEALTEMDVNSRIRMTNAIVESLTSQMADHKLDTDTSFKMCLNEVKEAQQLIENSIDEIGLGLEYHQTRFMHRWRMSSEIDKSLLILKSRLDILDKRVDMLTKCRAIKIAGAS